MFIISYHYFSKDWTVSYQLCSKRITDVSTVFSKSPSPFKEQMKKPCDEITQLMSKAHVGTHEAATIIHDGSPVLIKDAKSEVILSDQHRFEEASGRDGLQTTTIR